MIIFQDFRGLKIANIQRNYICEKTNQGYCPLIYKILSFVFISSKR